MPVTFTYDFTTAPDISYVRLQIADTDATKPIFGDDEIQAFLNNESGSLVFAAADALDALAALYARRSTKLQVLDIQVDFSAVAADLREQAKQLRQTEADSSAFAVVEMVDGGFAREERRRKEFERTQG